MEASEDIWTIDDVYDALEDCPETSEIKELLAWFHAATNDWPTMNVLQIDQILREFKEYLGVPITVDRIRRKKHDYSRNAWKAEASEGIALMLEASTRVYGEEEFEKVIGRVKEYVIGNKQRHANNR